MSLALLCRLLLDLAAPLEWLSSSSSSPVSSILSSLPEREADFLPFDAAFFEREVVLDGCGRPGCCF